MQITGVTGINEVKKMLDEVPQVVVASSYLKALQASITVFYDQLEIRTPVRLVVSGNQLVVEGGDLKGALVTEVIIDSNYRGGTAAVGYGKQGYVANLVEFGHEMVSHSGKKMGHVKAYPFMLPVFLSEADKAIEAFGNSMVSTLQAEYK